jgi:tetratricopeptide (TPR) repeat protein
MKSSNLHPAYHWFGRLKQGFSKHQNVSRWILLSIVGLSVAAIPFGWKQWTDLQEKQSLALPYRYPFERSPVSITGKLGEEIAFYKQRIQQDPGSGLNRAYLAKTYLKMARATGQASWYLLAEQTAQDSLAKLPFQNDGAIVALAKLAIARHEFDQALTISQQVEQPDETLPVQVTANLALGRVQVAQRASDRWVAQNPDLNALTLHALVQVATGQDQRALQAFEQALRAEEPDEQGSSAWTRTALGRFYYKRGQFAQAQQLYQEALRIVPGYGPALINSAELAIAQGDYGKAEGFYNQFFQVSHQSPSVYDHVIQRGMARIKDLHGDRTAAQTWRDRAEQRLRQDVAGFGHRRELARLLLERDRPGDAKEALALMQTELKHRRDAETLSTLAEALARLQRWPEAETAMQEVLQSGIRDPGVFHRAREIAQALGKNAQATAYFNQAQQIDPTFEHKARRALGLGVGLLGLN